MYCFPAVPRCGDRREYFGFMGSLHNRFFVELFLLVRFCRLGAFGITFGYLPYLRLDVNLFTVGSMHDMFWKYI